MSRSQDPPVHLHSFSLSDYYPLGVSAMLYHLRLNVLLLCGDGGDVSGWRLLDGFPHWAPALGQSVEKVGRQGTTASNIVGCMCLCELGFRE